MQCPLKFRLSVVDKIPQPTTEAQIKGTVVHEALEQLFSLPNESRSAEAAKGLLPAAWDKVLQKEVGAADAFPTPESLDRAKRDAEALVDNYFLLEVPNLNGDN